MSASRGHEDETTTAPTPRLDQELFRSVIGAFASGVTVITTRLDGHDYGTTASAFSSLSLEPPMVLVCLNQSSETGRAILARGSFAVNILGVGHAELAERFAQKSPTKFNGIDVVTGVTDLPLLTDALAQLECRVTQTAVGGTHIVFMAEVLHAEAQEGQPLAYFRGRFGRFEDAMSESAYRLVRRLVLSRRLPVGEPLDLEDLAHELDLEPPRLQYVLAKLTTDGLVIRDPDRGYMIKPLDARTADELLVARSALEIAVADRVVGHLDPPALEHLRTHAEEACRAAAGDRSDSRAIAGASRDFHTAFVDLMENDILADLYRRLGVEDIWTRSNDHRIDPKYLRKLTDACVAGDTAEAKRVIYEHTEELRRIARAAIGRVGGQM